MKPTPRPQRTKPPAPPPLHFIEPPSYIPPQPQLFTPARAKVRRESLSQRYRRGRGLYGVATQWLRPSKYVKGFMTLRAGIPVPKRLPFFKSGPRHLGLRGRPVLVNDFRTPPPGFVRKGSNSKSEWPIYRCLERRLGPEGGAWHYQVRALGGRILPGGAVIDFVVQLSGARIAIRVQSERYHIAVTSHKRHQDHRQKLNLANAGFIVVDAYEEHFMQDASGRAAQRVVDLALTGVELPNPLTTGTRARLA